MAQKPVKKLAASQFIPAATLGNPEVKKVRGLLRSKRLDDALEDWLRIATSPATVEVIPITSSVIAEMNRLPATFHQDPADRLIVATARAGRLPLATHDTHIRRSRQTSIWVA